jgi:predicted DNA-binding transcriptional regulator AlpA
MAQQLMNTEEASLYLRAVHGIDVSPRTLQRYRAEGSTGPRATKIGPRVVRYRREDVDAWALAPSPVDA